MKKKLGRPNGASSETEALIAHNRKHVLTNQRLLISLGIDRYMEKYGFKTAAEAGLNNNSIRSIRVTGGLGSDTIRALADKAGHRIPEGESELLLSIMVYNDFIGIENV